MHKKAFLGFVVLVSVLSAAQTATPIASPQRMFAPYLDMGKPNNNLVLLQAASGIRYFTLAFVVAGNGCTPTWSGVLPVADETMIAPNVDTVRSAGGDVIIAFGGYEGTDLAQACKDPASLQAALQLVVTRYKAKILDFDVEHFAIEDQTSIDRRSQALTALVAANPGLQINYTLPATPSGLTPQALNVLKSAVAFSTPVSVVNVMAMDYGYPVPEGAMGVDAVAAAAGTLCQMKSLGMKARVGITPMIGVNDTTTEVFTLQDARTVLAYAQANSNDVALLSFWSVGRDYGGCSGVVSPICSGIQQNTWDFSRIFGAFR